MGTLSYRLGGSLVDTNLVGVARANGASIAFGSSGAAPTFVAVYKTADFAATTTPKTVSVTVAVGDVLVCGIVGASNDGSFSAPTGVTGATWALRQDQKLFDTGKVGIYTTSVPTAGTYTMSVARAAVEGWGYFCYRFSGSSGIGASAKGGIAGTSPSLAVTTTLANSALVFFCSDFWEQPIAGRVWRTVNSITPTSGNGLEKHVQTVAGWYSFYTAYWNNAGEIGAKTTGLSAPADMGAGYAVVEVKGV